MTRRTTTEEGTEAEEEDGDHYCRCWDPWRRGRGRRNRRRCCNERENNGRGGEGGRKGGGVRVCSVRARVPRTSWAVVVLLCGWVVLSKPSPPPTNKADSWGHTAVLRCASLLLM